VNTGPMVIVVMDNRGARMIRVEQQMEHYPNFGTDLLNPDFAAYADPAAEGDPGLEPCRLEPAIRKAMELDTWSSSTSRRMRGGFRRGSIFYLLKDRVICTRCLRVFTGRPQAISLMIKEPVNSPNSPS